VGGWVADADAWREVSGWLTEGLYEIEWLMLG
jgi:hypothetical protein